MKKIIALLLAFVMCFGMFAGCNRNEEPLESGDPSTESTPDVPADVNLEKAVEYLRVYYKDAAEKTPMDYKRIGAVRIGTTSYPITWSVDIGDDLITVVDNGDGTVTIDINEEKQKEKDEPTNYVLTATLVGTDGRTASYSWNHILPAGVDNEAHAIIDAAYELQDGQSLEGTHTLTGVIVSIDTMYSEDYKNITVTIAVPGREDKTIQCYRLKGEGADKLAIGDTITVTGTLKNYKGTIEFDQGCVLEAVESGGGAPVEVPTDPLEILKAAFALAPGKGLPYKATLTGKIVEVNYPYTEQYGDVSVTIITNGYKVYCFRLKGAGADQLNVNDVITVNGQLTNYNGTIEFYYPTLLGLTNYAPPAAPTDPHQIVDAAYGLADGEYLDYTATLTGVISSFKYYYSEQYQSICVYMTIAGRENKPIYCYNLKGAGIQELDVGDTITVKGDIKNYMGTIEFVYPTLVSYVLAPEELTEDEKVLNALYELEPGESLEGEYSLTGLITEIGSPYSEEWGNITVTIVVEGHEDKPVVAFRMKGEGADNLAVGDTIKVTGGLTNYNGTYEFTAGCTFELISKGETETPDVPVEPAGTAEVMTELPVSGDLVVIYNSGNAMTATVDGKKLAGEAAEIVDGVLELTETMAQLTVSIDENGYYTFVCGDKYLTSGETGNSLTLADEASDYSLWTVEAATEGTWYIKNVNAKYNENVQSLEYYYGFTTFGHKDTEIYQMQILKVVEETVEAPIADGDQVVIYAPAYNKALSTEKTSHYNVGVDITVTDGVVEGFGETEIFTVIVNEDGTYSFAYGEQNLGMGAEFTSMNLGAEHDTWTLVDLGNGLYNIQNVGRGCYMEWYNKYSNWSTYASENAATDDQFQLSFYVVPVEEEPVVPTDPAEIIDAAYALEPGASLDYEATLTGEIISVDTEYSEQYGNITVTIAVEGSEDQPIMCFRLKGEGADALKVGDVITVTGTLKNYNGTIEFDAGCTLDAVVPGEEPDVPAEPVVEGPYILGYYQATLGKALYFAGEKTNYYLATTEDEIYATEIFTETTEEGTRLFYNDGELRKYIEVYMSGTYVNVTTTEEPVVYYTYNEELGTYVVNMEGTDYYLGTYGDKTDIRPSKTSYITGDNAANVGVTQYVAALVKNADDLLPEESEEPETPVEPDIPVEPDVPVEPVVPTDPAEIIDAAYALESGASLDYDATLTGEVVEIGTEYSEQYGNITVTIVVEGSEDQPIVCFRMKGEGADSLEVGDTITVTGKLMNYNGTIEFGAGCTLDAVVKGEEEEPEEPESYISAPFVMGMYQANLKKDLFFTGEMSGRYLATSEKPEDAVPVYMEHIGDDIRLFFNDNGAQTFIEIQKVGDYVNVVLTTQPTMFYSVNKELGTLVANVDGTDYYLGTYKNYNTISASSLSYVTGDNAATVGVSNFPVQFVEYMTYSGPFNLCMEQVKAGKTLYFAGYADGDYLATTEDPAEAAELIVLELYTGAAAIAFGDENGEAKFIEIYLNSSNKPRVRIVTQPESFFTYNSELGIYVTELEGKEYYLGTFGTYETIGASSTSYITGDNAANIGVSQFVAYLCDPVEEDVPAVPEEPAEPTAEEVLNIAYALAEGETTEDTYYLEGHVVSVDTPYSEQYGNVTVTIVVPGFEDKLIQCFRLKGDGADVLAEGDWVAVRGQLSNYKGKVQFAAGSQIEGYSHTILEKEVVEMAYALEVGQKLDTEYGLTGTITEINTEYNEQYGNITVTIVVEGCEDKPIVCFRMKGEGVDQLQVGDKIVVFGVLMNYNGTIEFDAGCVLAEWVRLPEVAPEEGTQPGDDFVYIPDEETPEVAPEETPEVAPEVTPEVAPEETPSEETTEEVTEETVDEPVEDETVVTE